MSATNLHSQKILKPAAFAEVRRNYRERLNISLMKALTCMPLTERAWSLFLGFPNSGPEHRAESGSRFLTW